MGSCLRCGAPVWWGEYEGERIPLDSHETLGGDFTLDVKSNLIPVKNPNVVAFPDHRKTCAAETGTRT